MNHTIYINYIGDITMKKILFITLFAGIVACSTNTSKTTLEWNLGANLPIPNGFTESIGVSGAFAGFIGDKLVVAGGANFPYAAVIEGGAKEFYQDIFVFDSKEDGSLISVGTGMMPKKLATGTTIQQDANTLLFVGGENKDGDSAVIYKITLNNNTPVVEQLGTLPFTFVAGATVLHNNKLYFIAGRQDKKSSNKSWVYDLATKQTKTLADLPGEARLQMPYALVNNQIFIFNGLGKITLTDAYVYNIDDNSWKKLADTKLNNKDYTIAGGAAVPLNDEEILILGGVNKEVFDDAVTQLGSLTGDALEAFRQDYFNRTPEQYDFSKKEVVYNITKNTWSTIGTIPFYGGAGPFPLLKKDNMLYRVSGEIKAGVRTPDIQVATIK